MDARELAVRLAMPLASVLPASIIDPAVAFAVNAVGRRHPGLADRLDLLKGRMVVVAPTDIVRPLALGIDHSGRPWARLATMVDRRSATASISGPVRLLVALLEGRVDGDAVFFSRALKVEGDMNVVVALRNALDSEDIDLKADVLRALGPLGTVLARLERLAVKVGGLQEPVGRHRPPEEA